MTYYYGGHQRGYGALGVISCASDAYDSIANGEADVETKKGREKIATTTANCAAAAACTAMGGAAVSELCGQVGEIIAEVLIDVFNDLAGSIGKFWGGGSEERVKRRREMVSAAAQGYEQLQEMIWNQWYKSLESTIELHHKLFGGKLKLEDAMDLYKTSIVLEKIAGTSQLKPKYLGDPPKCYPGRGCIMVSSAGYTFTAENAPGTRCGTAPSVSVQMPGGGYATVATERWTPAACPSDKISAYLYAQAMLPKMQDYLESLVHAEIRVGLALAQRKADQIAAAELADRTAVANARRAKMISDMRRARRARELEKLKQNTLISMLTQGSWGLLWRPQRR